MKRPNTLQRAIRGTAGVSAILSILISTSASADLDPSFGTGGVVTTQIGGDDYYGVPYATAAAVAVQADGKLVVAGGTRTGTEAGTPSLALARYNADGSLDTTFGTAGLISEDPQGEHMVVRDVALQSTGKVVVSGWLVGGTQSRPNSVFRLVRYNTDGTLDTTFNGSGVVTVFFGIDTYAVGRALVVQADDKLVVVGWVADVIPGGYNAQDMKFAVARLTADGALDPGFGFGGLESFWVSGSARGVSCSRYSGARDVAMQSDGKIVIVGGITCDLGLNGGKEGVALVRLHTNGAADSTFGTSGMVVNLPPQDATPWGGAGAQSLAIQPDGKIVVAAGPGFVLERFTNNGSFDTAFGTKGTVAIWFGDPRAGVTWMSSLHVLVQPDGSLVASGYAIVNSGGAVSALVSYTPDGTPSVPLVTTAIHAGNSNAMGLVRQPGGKLVVVGAASQDVGEPVQATLFGLARYDDTTGSPSVAACPATPLTDCLNPLTPGGFAVDGPPTLVKPGKGKFTVKFNSDDRTKSILKWRFQYGVPWAVSWASFGDPRIWDSYALCVYDDGALAISAQIPMDDLLWQREVLDVLYGDYAYEDKTGAHDGITKVQLRGRWNQKAKIQIEAKGATLPGPVNSTRFFNDTTAVVVQFSDALGTCHETTFQATQKNKNKVKGFSASF